MNTKRVTLMLLLVASSISSFAATVTWDNGGVDTKYETAANWSGDELPGASDKAWLNGSSDTIIYDDATGTQTVDNLELQLGQIDMMTMTGGHLIITTRLGIHINKLWLKGDSVLELTGSDYGRNDNNSGIYFSTTESANAKFIWTGKTEADFKATGGIWVDGTQMNSGNFDDYLVYNAEDQSISLIPIRAEKFHWELNEGTGITSSELEAVLTLGTAASWTTRNNSAALKFDGSSKTDVAITSKNFTLSDTDGTNDNLTIALWINPTALNSKTALVAQDGSFKFGTNNNRLMCTTYTKKDYAASSGTLETDSWQHVAVTFTTNGTSSTATYYINGQESGTATAVDGQAGFITTANIIRIGGGAADVSYNGCIDDVRVYGRVLSSSEITALYGNTILTPAIGIELVQTKSELSWTVEDEFGVKEYQVVNAQTGEVVEVVVAGKGVYTTTLPEGIEAKLVVVDNSGFSQTFLPADGNIVKVVYDLKEGWNLIALPGDNADTTALEAVTVGDFWAWNGSAYEAIAAPAACQGLWVYAPKAVQTVVTAEKSEADITLERGWNLVGPKENIEVPAAAHTVYGWNQTYEQILEDGIMIQGVGYWVFSL